MSKETIVEKIRAAARKIALENDLDFVHAQIVGSTKSLTIRVFVDKSQAGGVTHEDCALVSRQLDKVLDDEDFIPSSYLLEVSSPGLERELYSLADFKKFAGSLAKVKTNQSINGQKNFRGRINAVDENDEIIFDDKTNGTVRFAFDAVAKANLEIDLEAELKRAENGKRKTENVKTDS